jgi:hypothetical protein
VTTTTVTIGANEQLWETLTQPDFEALLDWFRRNGVDPEAIPNSRKVRIADGAIDYWSTGDKRPGGTMVVELRMEFDERPLQHLVSPVVEDMEPGLAERVHALWVARVEGNAQIAAQVAAAHAAAEYREKANQ